MLEEILDVGLVVSLFSDIGCFFNFLDLFFGVFRYLVGVSEYRVCMRIVRIGIVLGFFLGLGVVVGLFFERIVGR